MKPDSHKLLFKSQFENLSAGFWILLLACCVFVIGSGFYLHSSVSSILAAFSGICFAFFAGAMRIVCYFFGFVYCLSYAFTSFEAKLYGDVVLSLFYLPLNILGFIEWYRHPYQNTTIRLQSLSLPIFISLSLILFFSALIYGFILQRLSSVYPFCNAFAVVLQICATYLQSRRYVQSYLWITLANLIMIYIWLEISLMDIQSFLQFFNTCIFCMIGIIFHFKWKKEFKAQNT